MLANAAEYIDGKLYMLGGDYDTINTTALPTLIPLLVIVVKFVFEPPDVLRPRAARVLPLGPEGQLMRPPFEVPLHAPRTDSPEAGASLCLQMRDVMLPVLGQYTFRIELDGAEVAQVPLRVRLIQME
jgi:hypothetical protein